MDFDIRVQEHQEVPVRVCRALIDGHAVAFIGRRADELNLRELLLDHVGAAVAGIIVDDDQLHGHRRRMRAERFKAAAQMAGRVVADDQDAQQI